MKYIYTRDEVIDLLTEVIEKERRGNDAGTQVHRIIEKLMKEKEDEMNDDIDKLKRLVSVQIPTGEKLELGDVVYINDEGKWVKTK